MEHIILNTYGMDQCASTFHIPARVFGLKVFFSGIFFIFVALKTEKHCMQYKEIVSITGLSGLYQMVSSKSDGAIVRSLEDKSTKFVSSRQHNFTPLESIEIFTTGENAGLEDVFKAMQSAEPAQALPPAKADNAAIKSYFKKVYPDFDEERVYVSDMKKMLKWYELLKANDLLHFEEKEAESDESTEDPIEEAPAEKEKQEEKPKKKKK